MTATAIGLVVVSPWGRADAYRDALRRLDPRRILLISGEEEVDSATTVTTLARAYDLHERQALVSPSPGSGFGLFSTDPDLSERMLSFLEGRLR